MKMWFISLLACLPLTAMSSDLMVPPDKKVGVGESFRIVLPTSGSTGYSWIIRTLPPQVALTGMDYAPSAECRAGMTGCSGMTQLFFKAVKPGKGELRLQYARPWEPLPEETETTLIEVTK